MLIYELALQDRIKYSKRSLAFLDQVKIEKKIFKRRFSRRLKSMFISLKHVFRKNVNDRLVMDCSSSHTHTKYFISFMIKSCFRKYSFSFGFGFELQRIHLYIS